MTTFLHLWNNNW